MRRRNTAGFSLPELMVGIVIMGIMIVAAVPNMVSYRESTRMASACDRVAAACRSARARARSENHSIIVEYRTDEVAIVEDENDNGAADVGESVEVYPLPDGVTLSANTFTDNHLVFNGRGQAVDGGSVTLSGAYGVQPRSVRVSAGTGYVKVVPADG
jgi:prepilin-type N-terminal cleavage/methylation domain-containing protein